MTEIENIKKIYADDNIKGKNYRFTNGIDMFRKKIKFISLEDLLNKHNITDDTLNEIFVKSDNNSLEIIFDLTNGNLIEHKISYRK